MQIALYQPDIPQNTGTILRLAACLDLKVHLIHPAGFNFSTKLFRRTAMDYADRVDLHEHDSFDRFESWRRHHGKRLLLLSTKASDNALAFSFLPGDILMLGRESAGVPAHVADRVDQALRIPMKQDLRSLNVAMACALALPRALHMTGGLSSLQ
ncbi:MAG TPA: tRNA (cytidine(34)-2'-O)-methyltransferase [Devosia sp.]|nr:tRNA (cytidine(34)-2'-O)-methyltransferase [Devosia sp.]